MWKVELTEKQKQRLLDVYFKQSWDKEQEDGVLELKDAYRFIKDLMTSPVQKKNTSTQTVQVTNSTQSKSSVQSPVNQAKATPAP